MWQADLIAVAPATVSPVDFSQCETEAIETPGAIQSFGKLVAFDRRTGLVSHFSRNLANAEHPDRSVRIGLDRRELGLLLGVPWDLDAVYDAFAAGAGRDFRRVEAVEIGRAGGFGYFLSASPEQIVLEARCDCSPTLELPPGTPAASLAGFDEADDNVFALAQKGCELVKHLSGFDRVMIYRFAADWSGEVVAELCQPDMIPYIGLHYPASDIPARARQLFFANRLREIGDTMASTEPIDPPCDASAQRPLDLSRSITRAVSEYHIDYLCNMGVRASLTAALVVEGRLWGLVACHHRAPYLVTCEQRARLGMIADRLSSHLETNRATAWRATEARVARIIATLDVAFENGAAIQTLLYGALEAMDADGVAVVVDDDVVAIGIAPAACDIPAVARCLAGAAATAIFSDEDISEVFDKLGLARGGICGAAGVTAAGGRVTLIVFREEVIKTVSWGGDPSLAAHLDSLTGRLSPRRSFETWSETVSDRSRPWGDDGALFLSSLKNDLARPVLIERFRAFLHSVAKPAATLNIHQISLMNAAPDANLLLVSAARGLFFVLAANHTFQRLFGRDLDPDRAWSEPELIAHLGLRPETPSREGRGFRVWSAQLGARDLEMVRSNVLDLVIAGMRRQWFSYIFKDLTEVNRDRTALTVVRQRAEGQAAIATKFIAHISHELRTPLNAILGYSEMIATALLGPHMIARYGEYGADIHAAGDHLLSLIEQLLTISQIEAGERILVEQVCDLRSLIVQAVDWITRRPGASGDRIVRISRKRPLYLRADPVALRQVLINVIGNAVKFTPPGGIIEIDLRIDRTGGPELVVRDTGPGIAPHTIGMLFTPFRQSEDVYRRSLGGVGLGLAISKGLIDLHGGTIRLRSRPTAGTEVTVAFPARRLARPPFRRGGT